MERAPRGLLLVPDPDPRLPPRRERRGARAGDQGGDLARRRRRRRVPEARRPRRDDVGGAHRHARGQPRADDADHEPDPQAVPRDLRRSGRRPDLWRLGRLALARRSESAAQGSARGGAHRVRYRRVSGEFWLDSRVRALPHEDSRWQFLYILTCPSMTSVGAMRATVAGLAAELGWPLKRFRRALAPLVESGMVELNAEAAYIGLPKFLRHNPPESHNVVRGWVKALGLVPDCPEKRALVA